MRKGAFYAGAAAIASIMSMPASAAVEDPITYALTNGASDGDAFLDIDAFGRITSALFDPVGALTQGETIFDSDVFMSMGENSGSLGYLATELGTVEQPNEARLSSSFKIGDLSFELDQSLTDSSIEGARTGSLLTQSYRVSNMSDEAATFSLYRYLDGDLYLSDDTLADGGGVLDESDQLVLFQTDASGSGQDSNTFLGINASGGSRPATGAYEIRPFNENIYSDLFELTDTVEGDTDGDGFIDVPYDVTMTLRRDFVLDGNSSATFTTGTLFGNATLPTPGSSEALPLLPGEVVVASDGTPTYSFTLPVSYQPRETIFIDPVIAVGYIYEVTGSTFYSVTAPTLGAVPDGDGRYALHVGGATFELLAGQSFVFDSGVDGFSITGIDLALELDPNDAFAFVTGVAINDGSAGVTMTQTPITFDTDSVPAPVPLPASALLLGLGLGSLSLLRRKRRAS